MVAVLPGEGPEVRQGAELETVAEYSVLTAGCLPLGVVFAEHR